MILNAFLVSILLNKVHYLVYNRFLHELMGHYSVILNALRV